MPLSKPTHVLFPRTANMLPLMARGVKVADGIMIATQLILTMILNYSLEPKVITRVSKRGREAEEQSQKWRCDDGSTDREMQHEKHLSCPSLRRGRKKARSQGMQAGSRSIAPSKS